MAKLLLSVDEAAEQLGVGRTMLYELMQSGRVESIKIRKLRKIPYAALRLYVEHLREQQRDI